MATEKITLGAILKITDVDTQGIEGKLEKLSKLGGSSLGFSSSQIDQAKKLFNTIEGLSAASKRLGVNLSTQASGLNNILNRLDQANNLNLKVASVAAQIDKLSVALGRGEINGKRFDQTVRKIFQNLGRPEGFKEFVNDSLERAGKQLATKYNKELDALDKRNSQKLKQVVSQTNTANSINEKRDAFVGFNARAELDKTKAQSAERLRIELRAAEDIAAARTQTAEKQEEAAQNARRKAYEAAEKDRQKDIEAQKKAAFAAKRALDDVAKPKASQFPNNKTQTTQSPLRSEIDAYREFQKDQEKSEAQAAQKAIDRRNAITQLTREANDREITSKQKLIALQEKLLNLANQAAKVNDSSTAGGFRNLANKVAGTSSNDLTRRIDEITLGIVGNSDVSNRARKRVRSQAERQAINEIINGSGGSGGGGGSGIVAGGFGDFDKLNERLKESRNNFNRAATSANNFGLAIGLAIRRFIAFQIGATALYTVIGVLRTGADEALKFEKQLTGIRQAVEGIDSDKLGKIIRSNAVSTGNSATEIATGVKLLSQAGFDQFEQLETFSDKLSKIPLVQNFEGIDQTVNGLIAIFGQFNKTAKDTGQILDIVNQYSKDFAVESKDIFAAVSRAGGSFALAGGTLEEFTQLFTVLRSETRESAETLGTFFKTGLNQLFRPQSQDLLKQLGVDTTRDFVSQFRELGKILQSSNLSGLEKLDIGRRLLDESRQFPRFLSLINALADDTKFKKLKEASQDAFGSFNRSASERLNDVGQSFDRIKVSLQDLVNSLVSDGSFKSLVRTIADLTQGLAALLKYVAPLTPLLLALSTAKFSTKIGQTFKDFKSSFLEGIGGGGERSGVVAIPQRGLGRIFNRRNIAGGGLALAGAIATLGPALTESDSTAGRAISSGATFGLLGAAINPAVGAIAALTAVTISLSRSFTELEEKTLLNNALGAKTPGATQRATADLLNFGNNFNLTTVFSNSARGELARARLSNGLFGGVAGAFTGRLPNEQGLAQNRFNILRSELNNREGAGAAIANLVQRERDAVLRTNPNIDRDALRKQTFANLGGNDLDIIDQTILDRFIRLVFDKLGDGIKKALDSTIITDAFLQNANLNNLFNNLSDNLQPIVNKLAKSFLQLDTVITNFSTTQRATLSGDNQQILDSVFGSDNILSALNKQTQSFANEIGKVLSNPTIAEVFARSNSDTEGLSARSLIRENSALKDVDILSDKFAAIIDILAARSGQGADRVLSDLANSPNRSETIKQLSKNLQDAIESQVKSIREQVDVFNRELTVRQEINDRLLGLKDGIVNITSQIIDLAQQGGLRDLATDQFNNRNNPSFLNSIAEGNTLREQSQFSQFGDIGIFIDRFLNAQEDVIRSNEELQRINRGGFNPNDKNQRDAFIEAEQNRKRLIEADNELASRTDELRNRLGKAAQATDLLRNAAIEFKNSIDSAGEAVTQYTVRDLGDAIRAFRKFGVASGGFTNIRGGLNNITSDDFDKLTGLLGKLSSIPLGQGLTGSNLLGKINEDLGTRFAAIIRSQVSGRSVDVEETSIRQELATMVAEANKAAQEEKALRTNLNALLGVNIQSIEKEIFALDKQFIALDNISALLGPGNSLDTNVQNIYDLLKNSKLLQDGKLQIPDSITPKINPNNLEGFKPGSKLRGAESIQSFVPGPIGAALTAISATALSSLQPNNTRLSLTDSDRRDNGRRLAEQRENERLERIRSQIERKPYLLKQFSESDQQKLLSRYPELNKNTNTLGGANDKTAAKTDPNIVAITEGATKQLEVFNKAVSELSLLNQTSNVIKSILEEIKTGSGKTTATLEVAPMQVNVAISAPDILKLAGPQLAKNVIDAISPAISNAFGVVSEDARSVFNSGIGSV